MSGILGLDIGGANLKAAHSNGTARSLAFPLWKQPDKLTAALAQFDLSFREFKQVAVTMTGELCDCFATKREGVSAILSAVEAAFPGKRIRVWRTDGQFTDPGTARATPLQTGASNWHALATFVGRYTEGEPALLFDMGSTTTDIIPIVDGRPASLGMTDAERLKTKELVYIGLTRTPLCSIMGLHGMAEHFATMRDVNLLAGGLVDEPDNLDTADGRPSTREFAHARLARMVGADAESMTSMETFRLALRIQNKVSRHLFRAIRQVRSTMSQPPRRFIFAGEGECLLSTLVLPFWPGSHDQDVWLPEKLGTDISRAACAYAVAILAQEMADA